MSIPVKASGGGDFKLLPEGIHAAVCDLVANIGHQRITYKGEEKIQEKVVIRFEVPSERVEYDRDGQHFNRAMSISTTLTNNLSDRANLRKILESWRGRAFTEAELQMFDLMAILGAPAMITVTHTEKNGKTYSNISAVTKFQSTIKVGGQTVSIDKPTAEMPLIGYHPEFQQEKFEELPEWIKTKIAQRVRDEEVAVSSGGGGETPEDFDDSIPFVTRFPVNGK